MHGSEWKNKNVLITGISGFVGTAVARKLLEYGANVIGLVKEINGEYFFVEAPKTKTLGLGVGDKMPVDWGIASANQLAQKVAQKAYVEVFGDHNEFM